MLTLLLWLLSGILCSGQPLFPLQLAAGACLPVFGCTGKHLRPYFPEQESNLLPAQWKLRVLTTGPPGKFPGLTFEKDLPVVLTHGGPSSVLDGRAWLRGMRNRGLKALLGVNFPFILNRLFLHFYFYNNITTMAALCVHSVKKEL